MTGWRRLVLTALGHGLFYGVFFGGVMAFVEDPPSGLLMGVFFGFFMGLGDLVRSLWLRRRISRSSEEPPHRP